MKKNTFLFLSIIFPLGFSLLIYHKWISFLPFFNGDWKFFFKETLISNFFPTTWLNAGDINILIWRYLPDLIGGIFGFLGFNSNVSEKFLYFWPIMLLAPLGSFLLVRKITKSNLAASVGALVFSFNTYFLSIDTQGHELLTLAFCWGVFAILSFIYLMETKKKIFIPLTALLLFIVGSYDLRSLYVTAGAVALCAIYNQLVIEKKWSINLGINLFNSFITVFILFFVNLYWILPFVSLKALTSNSALSREIITGGFYSLQNVTALFYPFWTGAEPTWFFVQKIPLAFWLYPILAFIGLVVGRKNKQLLFFGFLALIGIFLTKQDSQPLGFIYKWFYTYIPGFNAFREASKFYFLIAISYAVLIGAFVAFLQKYFENKKFTKYFLIFLIAILPLWNTAPLLTGTIKTMFIAKTVPSDLKHVDTYLASQNKYSKILWANNDEYLVLSSNTHPVTDGSVGSIESWASQASINLNSLNLYSDQQIDGQKLLKFINSDIGKRMLSLGSYGYIVVSEGKNDLVSATSPNVWINFGYSLKKVTYLKQLDIGTQDTLLFENKEQRPHIYSTLEKESVKNDVAYKTVEFKENSLSEYSVSIKDINKPFYLNFSDNYDPNWQMYIGQFNWFNVLLNKQKVISDTNHFKNVVGFNSFYVDPQKSCDKNLNCSFTILFKPQAYLYLGLLISILTLMGTVVSGLYFYKTKP